MASRVRAELAEQAKFYFADEDAQTNDTSSTFADNVSLPIHRWFRYSAGFSALWVRELIAREYANGRRRVLDPFAGSGTVLLESELDDVSAIGLEAHPFVARIANAKLNWRVDPQLFRDYALSILERAKGNTTQTPSSRPKLIEKCFPPETLARLEALRLTWKATADGSQPSELTWLALTAIIRECSPVGTAQWQYVLPNKTKLKATDPFKAFEQRVYLMYGDMCERQRRVYGPEAKLFAEDARICSVIPDKWADLIITSPPYANNYDYADATRLEMTFFEEIRGWGDLQDSVRKYLIRSCTQHVAKLTTDTDKIISGPSLEPIRNELTQVCNLLEVEREKHGGRKPYHTMIAAYFSDLAKTWIALRRVTSEDSLICFVIGDSAPYGIYVPVERWLGELAVAAGFKSYRFEKTRDRNVKWENRKHRVPLHEGRLWVNG